MRSGKKEDIEKAKKVASKFPNYEPIQSQLMTIYMQSGKKEDLEKAIEIANNFPNNKVIQLQLRTIYRQRGKTKERLSRNNNIEGNDKDLAKEVEKQINTIFINQMKKNQESLLTLMRAKIYVGTIKDEDLQQLQEMMQDLDKKQFYLIQIATYEKLGQKNNALKVIKQMETEGIKIKELANLKDRLKSKKQTLFDLYKWDELIGWDVTRTEQYEEEERKKQQESEKQQKEAKQQIEDNKEQQDKITLPTIEKEIIINPIAEESEKETNLISVDIDTRERRQAKVKHKKKIKNKKATVEMKEDTISNTICESLKKVIEKINCHYYVEMQPRVMQMDYTERARQEKYIKKYDKLQYVLGCSANNKRAQIELMLILINEGYREVAKKEFPEEDYEFIDETIKQYYAKTIQPQEAKKKIEEYCI